MNNEYTASQLRLAADIIETGHPWGFRLLNGSRKSYNSPLEVITDGNLLIPILATPPDGRELHNPDSLTAEQVGMGYRLVLKSEPQHVNAMRWSEEPWGWEFRNDFIGTPYNSMYTYRLPLSIPWPVPVDPYTDLKAAHAAGKVIQFNPGDSLGWRDHPGDFTVGAEYYRIKPDAPPFKLPPPPPGMRWHREDGWKEGDLPPGTRPLMLEEHSTNAAQQRYTGGWVRLSDSVIADPLEEHIRTTRPLVFEHAGKSWTYHRPGDPMPCDGGEGIETLLQDGLIGTCLAKPAMRWMHGDNPIIGWRYAEPETKTVELGPEDCPPGSVFTKFSDGSYYSPSLVSVALDGIYFHDTKAFRKHYAELKKEGWQINRSIPLTGKWNADAWELCSKQVQL